MTQCAKIFFHLTVVLALTQAGVSIAQIPPELDLSRQRVPQVPLSNPDPSLLTPPRVNQQAFTSDTNDQVTFTLKDVIIEGSSVFPAEDLKAIFTPLLSGDITLKQLRDSISIIETRYMEAGYFLSRAYLPPQTLENDVARIQIVEGFVSEIRVEGLEIERQRFANQVLKKILNEKPLKFSTLESAMLVLNDLPGLRASSVLNPGEAENSSALTVTLEQAPSSHTIALRNGNSTVSGPGSLQYAGTFSQIASAWWSNPHSLQISANGAGSQLDKSRSVSTRLITAIGENGVQWSLGALIGDAEPGGAAQALGLTSDSHSFNTRLRWPLVRSRDVSLYLDTGLSSNYSRSEIGNLLLSEDQTTVGELGLYSIINTRGGAFISLELNWLHGLSLLGAMDSNAQVPSVSGFDSDFDKYTLSYLYLLALNEQWAMSLNGLIQHTDDKLLNGEVSAFGGSQIGRAFFPGSLIGDRGFGTLIELRYNRKPNSLQWFAFADYAEATLLSSIRAGQLIPATTGQLSSIGTGIRVPIYTGANLEFQWAHGLSSSGININQSKNKFLIAMSWSF